MEKESKINIFYFLAYSFWFLSVRLSSPILYKDSWEDQVLRKVIKKDCLKWEVKSKTVHCLPQAKARGMGFSPQINFPSHGYTGSRVVYSSVVDNSMEHSWAHPAAAHRWDAAIPSKDPAWQCPSYLEQQTSLLPALHRVCQGLTDGSDCPEWGAQCRSPTLPQSWQLKGIWVSFTIIWNRIQCTAHAASLYRGTCISVTS